MKHDSDDILDTKISIHDSRHFEIKLNIDLPESRSSSYEIETYFFVPKALNIAPGNYSKSDFYSGIQKYIRFKTPQIPLDRITDSSIPSSPWNRIGTGLDQLLASSIDRSVPQDGINSIFEEIKLLGQVTRASIRDTAVALIREMEVMRNYAGPERFSVLQQAILNLLRDIQELERSICVRHQEISRPQIPSKLKDGFRYFDEFFSLTVEEYLALVFKALSEAPIPEADSSDLKRKIGEVLKTQQLHRREMGYPSLFVEGRDNSIIPYRKGVLKKFTSSSLHLNLEVSEWQAISQLNFSIAAGVAMLFAAVVTVFAQSRFSTSSSMFIVIVVVSYILKDRMKDWLKVFLSQKMLRGAADQSAKIRDPGTGQVVGMFREAFAFMEYDRLPAVIRSRRNMDNITSIDEEGKPERVMKYEKQVTLSPRKIARFHQRRRDINDIMRFDISQWVKQADDPKAEMLHFCHETGTLQTVTCRKDYHINIVFKYQTAGSDGRMRDAFERIRLILNRDGIVQLDEVH